MKILGYVLIVLNLAAAGAFTYFATAIYKARTEWQLALLKQQMVNQGTLDVPPPAPEDLEEGSLPLGVNLGGGHTVTQITKARLKKIIPQGGEILGHKGPDPVNNQTDEVARVEKIVFANLDGISDPVEKRDRLMILLLNLSQGPARDGVLSLFRDWPAARQDEGKKAGPNQLVLGKDDANRQNQHLRDAAALGRSPKQYMALQALAAIADVNAALAGKANLSPEKIAARAQAARRAVSMWAMSEAPGATPNAWVTVNPPPADDTPPKNEERERFEAAVKFLQDEIIKLTPGPDQIKTAVNRLNALLEGDSALKSAEAKEAIPYVVAVGSNLLATQEDVNAAKAKLVELLLARAGTESEKKSVTALADLMVPPDPKLAADTPLDKIKEAQDRAFEKNVEATAVELLRSYFEEIVKKQPSNLEKLPEDAVQARSELARKSAIIDPAERRRKIAHLLYHLDGNLGADKDKRDEWYGKFVRSRGAAAPPKEKKEEGKEEPKEDETLPPADAAMLENRAKWHQRVAAIIGLEAYVAAAEAQAADFKSRSETLRKRTLEEQSVFLNEYRQIVQITLDLANELDKRQKNLDNLVKLEKQAVDQLKIENATKDDLDAKLVAQTASTKKALAELEAKSTSLFEVTRRLGAAQDSLIELEKKIRELEQLDRRTNKR